MRKIPFFMLLAIAILGVQWRSADPNNKLLPKKWRQEWSAIPAGKAVIGSDTFSVKAFYMQVCEVSNAEYKRFLNGTTHKGTGANPWMVDSSVWVRKAAYGEPYKIHYHRHPAYANYPVVGISYEAALAYCRWKQKEIQNELGQEYNIICKLPSREEWIRAARGDHHSDVYAWGGPRIRNGKGCALCNYAVIGDESLSKPIGENDVQIFPSAASSTIGYLSDNADILAPVNAYAPGQWGCMNMNGNTAELLEGGQWAAGGSWRNSGYDVRNESVMPVTEPTNYIGFRIMMTLSPK